MYKFCELKDNEFQKFVDNYENRNFMQTIYMNEYYKLQNKETYLVGIKEGKNIVAAALVCLVSKFKNYKRFAIYKGYLMDYNNKKLLEFMTKNIVEFLKKKKAYMFTIEPNIIVVQRDTNANIIQDGKNNYEVINYLNQIGYKKSNHDSQPKWTYVMDINNMSSDEIFKTFKQNTRNIINRTINKYKLCIKTVTFDELSEFKKITEDTSSRRGFNDKSLDYYRNMKKVFKEKVVFKIAELNCDIYLSDLYKEKKDYENKINKIVGTNKKKENYIQELNLVNKKINEITILKKDKGNIIPLSAAMFMLYGDEILYLFSGSYKEYMQYYGQYIIQWDIIKYACEKKYKRYNFYGIMDVFNNKGKNYGVYEFKKGFNGYVEELLGEYEYIIDRKIYKVSKFINTIKKIIKH